MKLQYIMFTTGAVLLVLAILVPFVVESPEDIGKTETREYSIKTSGLQPKTRHILAISAAAVLLCAGALYFYIEKLDRSLTCENDILRLRRYCRIYQYLLITAAIIFTTQIIFAVAGLLTVQRIEYAHLLHSDALGDLGILLVCVSMFLFPRKYIKAIRTAPPSVILAAKRKMTTLKREYDLLPRRFSRADVASLPIGWTRPAADYAYFRERAISEYRPGFYTLVAMVLAALVKHNKHLLDVAVELTKDNVPKHLYLSLVGAALCDLGLEAEGLAMIRAAVESEPSHSSLTSLAASTPDIEEKEDLANRVLSENPDDCDALRSLAYAKCSKGEFHKAEDILNRIIELHPHNIYALEFKGNIYFSTGEYQRALQQYRNVRLRPTPVCLQFKICHCYYLLGMMNKAKRIAKKIQDKIASAYDIEIEGGVEGAQKLLTEILMYRSRT